MSELDEFEQTMKVRKILTSTKTSILTPNLGKGFHLMCSYHRFQFIAKVIEYMVYFYRSAIIHKEESATETFSVFVSALFRAASR